MTSLDAGAGGSVSCQCIRGVKIASELGRSSVTKCCCSVVVGFDSEVTRSQHELRLQVKKI